MQGMTLQVNLYCLQVQDGGNLGEGYSGLRGGVDGRGRRRPLGGRTTLALLHASNNK